MPAESLRVVDLGRQPPLRSQTLWHAIAHAVGDGAPPTVSFVRPAAAYVSIGFHRRLEEVDLAACARMGLAVLRRMIGGGPVLLDAGQLFFQVTMPMRHVPAGGPRAMRALLAPAVEAFRDCGVDAVFDEAGDISVDGAKISGIGGGQIGAAAIAVGNVIESFDHETMAAVLAVDDEAAREETLRLMRRFVRPVPVDPVLFADALAARVAASFGLTPVRAPLTPAEERICAELDARFRDPEWLRGPDRPAPPVRQIKVRNGVWVFAAAHDGTRVVGSVVGDELERVRIADPRVNGERADLERALAQVRLADAPAVAEGFGDLGRRVAVAIARTDRRAL